MRPISAAQMREIERRAVEEFKISEDALMEHAGRSAAEQILNYILPLAKEKREKKEIIVVCGFGNNGGDGLVCARYLLENNCNVYCYIVNNGAYKPLVMKNLKRAFFSHLSVKEIEQDLTDLKNSLQNADVIVDALLGIGAEGAPRGIFREIINLINQSAAVKISIDVPSAFEVKPDYTYACGFIKEGCAPETCGKIKILDIGLPEELKNN